MLKSHQVFIDRDTIDTQADKIQELYIYLDYNRRQVQLYCNDEQKLKLNFVKIAKRENLCKSENIFWNSIKDILIQPELKDKEPTDKYILTYQF